MDYTEWLEREFFNFLECDGMIDFEENPDENPEERERVFKEWRKYRKEQFITFVKGRNYVNGEQNKEKTDE